MTSVNYDQRVIVIQGNSYYIPANVRIILEDGTAGSIADIGEGDTVGCRYRELQGEGNMVQSVNRVSDDPSYVLPQL